MAFAVLHFAQRNALGKAEAETRYVINDNKDAFDLWWAWAEKPVDSMLMIDAEIHEAVMALPPDERRDREKVNAAASRYLLREKTPDGLSSPTVLGPFP
jgi:hypothetical protein